MMTISLPGFTCIDKLFGQERFVKTSRLDRGNADLREKSQESHLTSPPSPGKQDEEAPRIVEQATG